MSSRIDGMFNGIDRKLVNAALVMGFYEMDARKSRNDLRNDLLRGRQLTW